MYGNRSSKSMGIFLDYFVERKTTTWRPCDNFLWAFSLKAITNEPLELDM
jgi:hypothetical protein